ncbi:hypothetical protein SAMN04488061_3301 [Filomicrobium insigne]|uniref:L,D-TPase catalytic domain-containing protein n=1 Tax=Filomicrobium insigne TaxID=418854 RepID=A0A1H0TPC5_9HYPH|nr:murein L,D-transpeptidase family protein [Filomicrobium insigne]SDP55625.1 hypothetical protein SAMN04488061_3301 [Filomicrobium insigne]
MSRSTWSCFAYARSVKPLAVGLVGLSVAILILLGAIPRAYAISIELKGAAPDRIERQRQAANGDLPLPSTPNVGKLDERLANKQLTRGNPVLLRIFKDESEFEIWMKKDNRYVHFATYPICHWSGDLGPKLVEGDKQSPEGFYTITRKRLHRSGRWPRSFNLGFPNVLDRSLLRTGSYLLIHGGCSSVGCYAMTDAVMTEIFGLVYDAIKAGQDYVPVHVFPFRMTNENLASHVESEWRDFWINLKEGYDSFERTRLPPRISVCNGRYSILDAAPGEGGAHPPLAVCGETAAVLQAEETLQNIVHQPSRWKALSVEEQKLVALLPLPIETIAAQHLAAKSTNTKSRPPRAVAAGPPLPRLQCNLGLASCRRFLALQQRSYQARTTKGKTGVATARSNRN